MAKQSFVYNSSTTGLIEKTINVRKPIVLRAAGLTDCVPITMMVGDCPSCRPEDVLWQQVYECGKPLELCPDNPSVVLTIPGTYALGDPSSDPQVTISGDVNITKQEGVDPSLLGKCNSTPSDDEPSEIVIDTSCQDPLFVELCSGSIGIEASLAPLGCLFDENGAVSGKVFVCKIVDEETGEATYTKRVEFIDGSSENNYTGVWSDCNPVCQTELRLGLITDINVLRN